MYLNEAKSKQEKDDLAMFIAEVLNQRIQGTKNKVGVYVTPSFPKLLYVLEEDNITEDSEYWWLTELAAKCTAKRMVPDYISEKVMIELKGYCFPCMGKRNTTAHAKNRVNRANGCFCFAWQKLTVRSYNIGWDRAKLKIYKVKKVQQ